MVILLGRKGVLKWGFHVFFGSGMERIAAVAERQWRRFSSHRVTLSTFPPQFLSSKVVRGEVMGLTAPVGPPTKPPPHYWPPSETSKTTETSM